MSLKDIMTIASSETVFAVLFVAFLWIVIAQVKTALKETRESAQKREEYILTSHEKQMNEIKENMLHERASSHELMVEQRISFDKREQELLKHLNKNTEQLGNIAETLKDIQNNLKSVENRMEDNFMDVWKELGNKIDKHNAFLNK